MGAHDLHIYGKFLKLFWAPQSLYIHLLDHGDAIVKKTIAQYVGVPFGERLQWTRYAADLFGLSADDEHEGDVVISLEETSLFIETVMQT